MADLADIVALAPDADRSTAAAVVRSLRRGEKVLAAAVCRGGHLHVLTNRALYLADRSFAHEEASKSDISGAVVTSRAEDEVNVSVMAFGGLQPPHRFAARSGLLLVRQINTLAGQPPEGPPVSPVGPGRVTGRPSSWLVPGMLRAGDDCDVSIVPDGVHLYFSSGDYPMSTVLGRADLVGVLPVDQPVLLFSQGGEFLEVELQTSTAELLERLPDAQVLGKRPEPPAPRHAPTTSWMPTQSPPRAPGGHVDPASDEAIVTRDGVRIRRLITPAAEADARWAQLTTSFERSKEWPVILGHRSLAGFDELVRFLEDATSARARPAPEILAAAAALDAEALLARRWEEGLPGDDDEEEAMDAFDESEPKGRVRPIPEQLTLPADSEVTVIAVVPVAASDEIPAVVGWGGWNACPPPEQHVAVLRWWRRRYGAELKAMSPDTLELAVAHPPASFADALPLAREQYAYAPDIVDQGEHGSIGELAAALAGSTRWHFWWD